MELSSIYAEALENDEPIQIEGLTLYPIKMRFYRQFHGNKASLLIRQSSLPVDYAVMSYLLALFAMDFDVYEESKTTLGFMSSLLRILSLSTRLPVDALAKSANYETDENDQRILKCIHFRIGENIIHLTPALFDKVRVIIAEQNGLELPDETENVDLVESEMDIAAKNTGDVEFNMRTLLASVARDQRCRREELLEYTIREFDDLRNAIERDKLFTIYRTAELSGNIKFENGNPVPSWCFERKGKSNSLISMSKFMAGPGSVATMK